MAASGCLLSCLPIVESGLGVLGPGSRLLLGALAVQAPVYKLNPPLPRAHVAEVDAVEISQDNAWVVFRANPLINKELFSVPIKGGRAPINLGAFNANSSYDITLDSRTVLFQGSNEIYRVPVDGSHDPVSFVSASDYSLSPDGDHVMYVSGGGLYVVSLSGDPSSPVELVPAIPGVFLNGRRFTPDGRYIVYIPASVQDELYSVPIDGSAAPARLNGPLVANGDVQEFAISPDGRRVIYLADQDLNSVDELYSVPIDGSLPAIKLNPTLSGDRRVQGGDVLPGSRRATYVADQDLAGAFELYSVPIEGEQPPIKLNRPLPPGGNVLAAAGTADGNRVVYFADQDQNNRPEIYGVASDGSSGPVKLNHPLGPGSRIVTHQLSPDTDHVVYRASQGTASALYSVSTLQGREATQLTGPITDFGGFMISPDGWVVYQARVEDVPELFSVPIDGSQEAVKLNGPLAEPHGAVQVGFLISSDGERVVFRADADVFGVHDLFSAPIDGSEAAVRLSPPMSEGQVVADVSAVEVSSDGTRAVFRVDVPLLTTDGGSHELYSVALDGDRECVKLFPRGAVAGRDNVAEFEVSPQNDWVVFRAGSDLGPDFDLFGAPLDGRLPAVRLNERLQSGYGPEAFELTGDGALVVYSQWDDDDVAQVFVVPSDGSSPPLRLSQIPPSHRGASSFEISPDGERVVFVADSLVASRFELCSVPIDGSAPPLPLSGPLDPGRDVLDFMISQSDNRIVYRVDPEDDVFELYGVPIDGSQEPAKLSGPMVAGGDVWRYQLAGNRVAFVADADSDERFELYSAPTDGSAPRLKLNGSLMSGGDVQLAYGISSDGCQVVYRADQEIDETVEIYSVPIDRSTEPLKVSSSLVERGDVLSFEFVPDRPWVVYRADQEQDEVFELYAVPIDRRAPSTKISGALREEGDVLPGFRIAPDGEEVFYRADQRSDEVFELFRTPLDASKNSKRVNTFLVEGGDVADAFGLSLFEVTPDSSRVLYVADQDTNGVHELYMALLGQQTPGRSMPAQRQAR